jgi:Holliday junction resolvase RusA-like endonuclease
MITFVIPGEPKAKQRPRVGKWGAYTPKMTVQYENWVKQCYVEQANLNFIGEITATITAYFGIPKSTSKKKKEQMLLNKIKCTKKPDTDNIAKIVLDSLNGIAYKDDSQIVELHVFKKYSEEPRVEVELEGFVYSPPSVDTELSYLNLDTEYRSYIVQ